MIRRKTTGEDQAVVARRRTVTTSLQATQISEDFQSGVFPQAQYHMPNIERKSNIIFDMILDEIVQKYGPVIATSEFIRFVLDDSQTIRYR